MIEWLTLAMLAQPECHAAPARAALIVAEAERAERRHHLPSGLLVAVVLAESGGLSVISRRRSCGGRDVGPAQIHEHDRARMQRLLVLATNLDEGARILSRSRATCERHPGWAACRRSRWALYNARAPRWWSRVADIWRRLRGWRGPSA